MSHVSSILMGGLGNYMFQVAAAYAYGKRYGLNVGFNCAESSGPHKHVTEYHNNVFKNIDLFHIRNYESKQYTEPNFYYQEIPKYDSNVLLFGYFQSEKFFSDYKDEIKELFTSYEVKLDDEILDVLDNHPTCSIHVRRGDYLKSPNHHPTQSMEYYNKAINELPTDTKFFIFSDDIEWCKNNFPDEPDKFKFIEGNKDYEDLFLMSRCNNNIICNSTFSWWGAWLNNNENKIVVAPSNWFGPLYYNHITDDLYGDNWIKI